MKKLFMTTTVAVSLFSGVAYAGDTWPILTNMAGIIDPAAKLPSLYGNDYFTSGRAAGRVPPAPDSTSVTTDNYGRTAVTQTWNKKQ